jgi:hypothetical protein
MSPTALIPHPVWLRGLIAYLIYTSLGHRFLRATSWLLPWAGDYAYWNDPWVRWCREVPYRAPRNAPPF